jgi:hypothetical protein
MIIIAIGIVTSNIIDNIPRIYEGIYLLVLILLKFDILYVRLYIILVF